jgi:hypothetical protein
MEFRVSYPNKDLCYRLDFVVALPFNSSCFSIRPPRGGGGVDGLELRVAFRGAGCSLAGEADARDRDGRDSGPTWRVG